MKNIRWGRVIVAAVLSEVGIIAALMVVIYGYRLLINPNMTAEDFAAYGQAAGYYVAPAAAPFATFFGVLWVARKLTSSFVANGVMVGVLAVILTVGFAFSASAHDRVMYIVSFVLRIVGGYLGGLVAQRQATRKLTTATA